MNNHVNLKNLDCSVKDKYYLEDVETLADTRLKHLTLD